MPPQVGGELSAISMIGGRAATSSPTALPDDPIAPALNNVSCASMNL
jgi:hypothetical protein